MTIRLTFTFNGVETQWNQLLFQLGPVTRVFLFSEGKRKNLPTQDRTAKLPI